MKKTIGVLAGLGLLISLVAFTTFAPPKWKNLKILPKDISDKALDSIMEHYTVSLGTTCNMCHVHDKIKDTWDMASDAKGEKLIARKMMLMTDGINKKYFPPEEGTTGPLIQTVTCFTCHKGEAIPLDLPPPKEEKKEEKK